MPKCMYCDTEMVDSDSSLEHVIPQFLGGAYAPDRFKTRLACRRCNNNLGLFVDAAFEKDGTVGNNLAYLARESLALQGDQVSTGVPLICFGLSDLSPPGIQEGEVCESWLGPHGEQVYLIRQSDDQLYWYSGGNPIAAKQKASGAYFQFSENSHKDARLTWFSFRDAFEGKKARKIMVTQVNGADPALIGFVEPDELDRDRAIYFREECANSKVRKNKIPINVQFDHRFLGKLALGVSLATFGQRFIETSYCAELRKLIWFRGDDNGNDVPEVFGSTAYAKRLEPHFLRITGLPDAVVLTLVPVGPSVALTLNIAAKQAWVVMCAKQSEIDEHQRKEIGSGIVLALSKARNSSLQLTQPEFLNAHLRTSGRLTFSALTTRRA
ncbi:MAG: HNH endonuclease [Rhodoferax sp.]